MKGRVKKSFTGPHGVFKKGAIVEITPLIAASWIPGLIEPIKEETRTTTSKKAQTAEHAVKRTRKRKNNY